MEELLIRPISEQDLNLVLATWLNSFYHAGYAARGVRKDIYFHYHEMAIRKILLRSQAKALMACDKEDPYVVYGYFVFEDQGDDSVLHYAYVKKDLRGMGIFRALLQASGLNMRLPLEYTHKVREFFPVDHTDWRPHWIYSKYPDLIHNPYKL